VRSRNLLVVVLEPVPDEAIHRAIEKRKDDADVNVLVVAPAMHVGPLQWLTGAEDEARAEAEELAEQTARAVDAEVETEVGDRDPLLAVEDALSEFSADEIVLTGAADDETEVALRRFGIPVERVDGTGAVGTESETLPREVTRGWSARAPFIVFAAVGGLIISVIVFISLVVFLVGWLA
jgi:hypothetical protein